MNVAQLISDLELLPSDLEVYVTDCRNGCSERCEGASRGTFWSIDYEGGEIHDNLAEGESFAELYVG